MTKRNTQKKSNQKYQVSNRQLRANVKYKDTIFRMLYKEKKNLLSLYNAVNDKNYTNPDDLTIFRLSSAYEHPSSDPDLELRVTMFNVNEGHNKELMDHCHTLKEYAQYVTKIRKYTSMSELSLEDSVKRAVNECIEEGILSEFLLKNKAEVIKMSIYEYDKEFEEKTCQRKICR